MGRLKYAGSLLRDVVAFARQHKAYWIVPLLLVIALVCVLVFTSQATAPFIYTLF